MTTTTLPLQDRPTETARSRVDSAFGMAIFIGAWSMAFATMFLAYMILRQRQPIWPPDDVVLPSLAVAIGGTLVLLASSFVVHRAVGLARAGRAGFARHWNVALALGLIFAALQTWLWADLWSAGRFAHTGMYETLFYGLTWFHAAHVACGLIALGWVSVGIARKRYGHSSLSVPVNVAVFWHFVDVVWVVLFVTFFLT